MDSPDKTRVVVSGILVMHGSGIATGLALVGGACFGRPYGASCIVSAVWPACAGVTNHNSQAVLRYGAAEVGDDNGKRAKAAVMRYGY